MWHKCHQNVRGQEGLEWWLLTSATGLAPIEGDFDNN